MKRYLRIYRLFFTTSWQLFLSHRFNFMMGIVANILWTISQLITIQFLFFKVKTFMDWSIGDMILLLGLGQIYVYTSWLFFEPNFSDLFNKINSGAFDRMLTKPVNIKFLATFERVMVSQLLPTITTVIPLIGYGLYTRQALSFFDFGLALIVCFLGVVAMYLLGLTLSGLIFFFEDIQSVRDLLTMQITELSRVPLSVFPKFLQQILTFVIPLAFIAFYPVQIIRNQAGFGKVFLIEMTMIMVFYLLSKITWKAGLRRYSGVG